MASKTGKILVVDDNLGIRRALEILLPVHFAQVKTIPSPATIVSTLEQFRPDVVLLDMNFNTSINTGGEGLYWAGEIKQIAVRKVFGADVNSETWRNVRSYMVLTGIACLIGIPLAIWAAQVYLQRFSYRVEGYGWVFVVAVVISLAIAFVTVLWQTLKAAKTNPATELKKE